MTTGLIVLLTALCVVCYAFQTFFAKLFALAYPGDPACATPVFASLYGAAVGVATLAASGFAFAPSPATWALGVFNGGVLFLYNLSVIRASRTGPYAFQSIMMLFGSVLLPLLFSTLYWGDTLGGRQLGGIALVLVSFLVINCKGLRLRGAKRGYLAWVGLLFAANGAYSILMDAQQRAAHAAQRNEMIIITFLTSAVVSLAALLLSRRGGAGAAFRMGAKAARALIVSSAAAAVAVNLMMTLLSRVQTAVLYAVLNSGILAASVLLSAVVLHEKLEKHTLAGIAVGLCGIVLLSV